MSIKQRIKTFCELEKISVMSFEKAIDVSNGFVNASSKSIGVDKLQKILEVYPQIDLTWLVTGEGDMYKKSKDSIDINQEAVVGYLIRNFDSLLKDRNFKIWYENLYAKARYEIMKESLGMTVIGNPNSQDNRQRTDNNSGT